MAEIPNRDELEAQLARKLGKLSRAQMGRLLELLGDPPRVENVPPTFWDEAGKEMVAALSPFLEKVYLEQARRMLDDLPIGVDWALVNKRAVEWASRYTFDLVRGINDTTRDALQANVARYFEQGLTIGDLEDSIAGLFGPVRAEMISVTEITRASTEGERAIAAELAEQGIVMRPVWNTSNDELVCPICEPRNQETIEGDDYPPAHPRCRCSTSHELIMTQAEIT